MAILFIDGFDHYASGDQLKAKWSLEAGYEGWSDNTIESATPSPRHGYGKYLELGTSTAAFAYKYLPSSYSELFVGFAYYTDDLTYQARGIAAFSSPSGRQFTVTVETNGSIKVFRGDHLGTNLGTSSTGIIAINTWYYIEVWVKFSDTAGDYDIIVDGSNVLAGTGTDDTLNYTGEDIDGFSFRGQLSSNQAFDDFSLADNTGGQTLLGDCRVETI